MRDDPFRVGILTAVAGRDNHRRLTQLVQILADRGVVAELLDDAEVCPRHCRSDPPAWVRRWRRFWSVRSLASRAGLRPHLIHAMGIDTAEMALDLADRWRVPYVLTIEEFLRPGERFRLNRRWCHGVVATGADLADDLVQSLHLPARILSIVPPGICLPVVVDRSTHKGCVPVVGVAGDLALGSGLPVFLEAARLVLKSGMDVEFVIAAGSSSGQVRLLAEGLGIADRITLAESGEAGPWFWAVLDVYCQPMRSPNAGRSLSEAMAHGIPSIATDVPGLRAWISDQRTGRIVPPGDAASLATAILDNLENPAKAADLGRRAREQIETDFSMFAEADALADLYLKAAEPSAGIFAKARH